MNLERFARDPDGLMAFAAEGNLTKAELAELLTPQSRVAYLQVCAAIERAYTEACAATGDPCLESGCSIEAEGEICLQPVLNAGPAYQEVCAAEWIKVFRDPRNRNVF